MKLKKAELIAKIELLECQLKKAMEIATRNLATIKEWRADNEGIKELNKGLNRKVRMLKVSNGAYISENTELKKEVKELKEVVEHLRKIKGRPKTIKEVKELREENECLKKSNLEVQNDCSILKDENRKLKASNGGYYSKNLELKKENDLLKRQNKEIHNDWSEAVSKNIELIDKIESLKDLIRCGDSSAKGLLEQIAEKKKLIKEQYEKISKLKTEVVTLGANSNSYKLLLNKYSKEIAEMKEEIKELRELTGRGVSSVKDLLEHINKLENDATAKDRHIEKLLHILDECGDKINAADAQTEDAIENQGENEEQADGVRDFTLLLLERRKRCGNTKTVEIKINC